MKNTQVLLRETVKDLGKVGDVVNVRTGFARNYLVPRGLGMTWSSDGRWVYYLDEGTIYKIPAAGGTPVVVRPGPARNVVAVHGTTLLFMVDRTLTDGSPGFEIHAASPEDAPSRVIARIAASRAPQWQIVQPALSPDGQTLALPLTDGATTNIWTLSTATGAWRGRFSTGPSRQARRTEPRRV